MAKEKTNVGLLSSRISQLDDITSGYSNFEIPKKISAPADLDDVEFMSSNLLSKVLFLRMLTEKQNVLQQNPKFAYKIKRCLFSTKSMLRCLILISSSSNVLCSDGKLSVTTYQRRKLLSVLPDKQVTKQLAAATVNSTDNLNTSNSTKHFLKEFTVEEYEELVRVFQQTL